VEEKIKKNVLCLVGKLEPVLLGYSRSFQYMVKMERETERERERKKNKRERDREQRKNGVAIGFCIF